MVANWGFNIGLGLTALILTFCFSWGNNTWQTSLFRAAIGFILFYVLGYLLQMCWRQIGPNKPSEQAANKNTAVSKQEEVFQPISLTSLHGEIVPEKVAQITRTWVEEDQEG